MNRLSRIACLALAAATFPGVAAAQTAQPAVTPSAAAAKIAVEQAAVAGGRGRLMATVETRTTTGRPYSAEAVTESLQVLGDGNRIARRTTTRVFRDSEGRTRREQLAEDGLARSISITDPVGGASFTLDPSTKTAFRAGVVALTITDASGRGRGTGTGTGFGTATGSGSGGGGGRGRGVSAVRTPSGDAGAAEAEARRLEVEKARIARVEMAETSRAAATQMKQVIELAASGGGTTTKEDLGEQVIEGVRATGTRSTTVIPASAIGNLHEIRIVSEQWFSPDLEVLVLTRHSDPRLGETTYKLTNIVRGQPDPNFFTVPPDYTVKGRNVRNQ